MRKILIFILLFILVIINISCNNRQQNTSGYNDQKESVANDTSTIIVINDTIDTVNLDLSVLENVDKDVTKYDINGEVFTLNGKVKKMYSYVCGGEIINGKLGLNDELIYWDNTIEFNENVKTHDYYKSCGGGWWDIETYDSLGKPLVKTYHSMYEDDPVSTKICIYDEANRLAKEYDYLNETNEIVGYSIFFYDTTVNSMIRKDFHYGAIDHKYHTYFDDNGEVISRTIFWYKADTIYNESFVCYSYKFDDYGNWIIRYETSHEKDRFGATVREIEYYE
ncbi:MAG: hypothetical protein C0596_04020 [Marinilabiliales bacterium]|nr:MAG: hypothetical protein C0596_04020 [Marinilabiliales bacterium]